MLNSLDHQRNVTASVRYTSCKWKHLALASPTCPLQLRLSSQKLSSGPEAGPAWNTWETRKALKSFGKILCCSISIWIGQNFASDWFLVAQGYSHVFAPVQGEHLYTPHYKSWIPQAEEEAVQSVPQACQTSLISRESLITKRLSPFFHRALSVISMWALSLDLMVVRNAYLSWR